MTTLLDDVVNLYSEGLIDGEVIEETVRSTSELEKEAGILQAIGKFFRPLKEVVTGERMKGIIEVAAPALAIGVGAEAAMLTAKVVPSAIKRHKSLGAVLADPDIPEEDKDRAKEFFSVLDTFAPTMAEHPLVAKSFVKNLLQFDDVHYKLVGDLISAQRAVGGSPAGISRALDAGKTIIGMGGAVVGIESDVARMAATAAKAGGAT